MRITSVELYNFSNHSHTSLDLGNTYIMGKNGIGKSSIVDAIYFARHGKSYRNITISNLVKFGTNSGYVTMNVVHDNHIYTLIRSIELQGSKHKTSLQIIEDGNGLDFPTLTLAQDYLDSKLPEIIVMNNNTTRDLLNLILRKNNILLSNFYDMKIINKAIEKIAERMKEMNNDITECIKIQERYTVLSRLTNGISEYTKEDEIRYNELSHNISNILQYLNQLLQLRVQIESEYKTLKDLYDKLKSGICPLCGSKVVPPNIDPHMPKSIEEINTLYSQLTTLKLSMESEMRTLDTKKFSYTAMQNAMTELNSINIHEINAKLEGLNNSVARYKELKALLQSQEYYEYLISHLVKIVNIVIAELTKILKPEFNIYIDSNTIMVQKDNNNIDIELCSSGEQKAIKFIVYLAILMLMKRSSVILIDEFFDSALDNNIFSKIVNLVVDLFSQVIIASHRTVDSNKYTIVNLECL